MVLRIVVAEASLLAREGIARLLPNAADLDVVRACRTGPTPAAGDWFSTWPDPLTRFVTALAG